MSDRVENAELPDWVHERFGPQAAGLRAAIPRRLAQAHGRARDAHKTAGLKKRGPYGHVLAEAVREQFAEEAVAVGGAVRELRGYAYAVINGHALFPYKYADRPADLSRARLKADASPHRKRIFTAHGPEGAEGLFPVDDVLTTDEYDLLHEAFEELGRTTKLVSVFFAASLEAGIHVVHWGEARLESDRTFTWSNVEQLTPVAV